MTSILEQIEKARQAQEPRVYIVCKKKKGWPRINIRVCQGCKNKCKEYIEREG